MVVSFHGFFQVPVFMSAILRGRAISFGRCGAVGLGFTVEEAEASVQGRAPAEKVARRLMARHGAVFSLHAGHPPPRDEIMMRSASAPFDTR